MKNKYSIVHNGPIAYKTTALSAYSFRDKCIARGYFIDRDTKKKIAVKQGDLKIFMLWNKSLQWLAEIC